MNTYSRALKHIDMKGVKQRHQEKLIEQKIQRRIEREERQYIQSIMETKKSDWRKELNEQMTTTDVFFATLPATGDTNLAYPAWNVLDGFNYTVSGGSVTITSPGTPGPDKGIAASFDSSFYSNLVFDVSVSGDTAFAVFQAFVDSPILISASSGTYSIRVPQSSNLELLWVTPSLSVGTVTISNLRFQRQTPINVFVPLNSPEATSFIRTDPNFSNLSPEERNKKLKEMIESGDEYLIKMFGSNFPGTGAVPPGEYDPFKQDPPGKAGDTPGVQVTDYQNAPGYMNIKVGDKEITRQYDRQGNYTGADSGWQPDPNAQPQSQQSKPGSQNINFTHTYDVVSDTGTQRVTQNYSTNVPTDASGNLVSTYSQQKADELSKAVDVARAEYLKPGQTVAQRQQSLQKLQAAIKAGTDYALGKTSQQSISQNNQSQIQKTVLSNPEVANAVEKLGTAGKTYLDYLTNNLPDVIDNNYLGQKYVNSIFKNAQINHMGTVSVGDNIVGTGGKATYNPKTKQVSIPFNYDFKTNEQEFNDPSKAGRVNDFQKAVLNAVGPYSADAQLNTPILPLNSLAGIVLGGAIGASKALGGGQQKPGNVTIDANKLKQINPNLYNQVVKEELIVERRKLKSPEEILNKIPGYYTGKPAPLGFPETPPPEMVNGMHPDLVDGKKTSDRFNRLDPESAKATPLTGNPHIDKKIKAARKKPK